MRSDNYIPKKKKKNPLSLDAKVAWCSVIILLYIPSVRQTVIHLPIFWPSDLPLTPSDVPRLQIDTSGGPWGAFAAVRQTLSDNSALVGMSNLRDPRKDDTRAEEEGAEMLTLRFFLFGRESLSAAC